MSAAEIAIALTNRPQRLKDDGWLVPCPVPSHGKGRGDRLPSLRIRDGASRLLVHCFGGCDARDILEALRRRGFVGKTRRGDQGSRSRPATLKNDPDAYTRQQHRKASWLWSQRQPIKGSVAEKYLRARGITCELPPTLAFLPPRKAGHHSAMIAAFALPGEVEPGKLAEPCNVEAVHLTLVKPDGTGKAEIDKPKLMVGSTPLPIMIAPPNDLLGLAITEGIEDALTAHQATGLGAWAAGSAGRMPALAEAVLDYIETLTIFADGDKAGRDNARALAAALRNRGIAVVVEGMI